MWLYRKTDGWFPMWDKDIPRRNVRWDMLMIGTENGPEGNVFKNFDSDGSEWYNTSFFSNPQHGIDVDELGNVYSCGNTGENLFKYDYDTGVEIWQTDVTYQCYDLVYNQGYLYVATSNGLRKFGATSGNLIWTATASTTAVQSVDIGDDGYLYFVTTGGIKSVDQSGNFLWESTTYGTRQLGKLKCYGTKIYFTGIPPTTRLVVYNNTGTVDTTIAGSSGQDVWSVDVNANYVAVGCEWSSAVDNLFLYTRSGLSLTASISVNTNFYAVSFNRYGELLAGSSVTGAQLRKLSATLSTIWTYNLGQTPREIKARYTF